MTLFTAGQLPMRRIAHRKKKSEMTKKKGHEIICYRALNQGIPLHQIS